MPIVHHKGRKRRFPILISQLAYDEEQNKYDDK